MLKKRWQRVSVNTIDLKRKKTKQKKPSAWVAGFPTHLWLLWSVFLAVGQYWKDKRSTFHTDAIIWQISLSLACYYLIDSQFSTPEECDVICSCVISSVTLFMLYYSFTICYYYPLQVLGREVYTSNNQLGGIQIMHNNGVTHNTVCDDFEGVFSLLLWLSYMPKVGMLCIKSTS